MPGSAHTWVDGDVATAAFLNAMPRGLMGQAIASVAQSGISATVDITSCTTTFTAISSRWYRTTLHIGRVDQSTATGIIVATIADAASTALRISVLQLAATEAGHMTVEWWETGITGATTRKARLATTAGTVATAAGAGNLPFIVVEDMALA